MRFTRLAIFAIVLSLVASNAIRAESKWSLKSLIPGSGKKQEAPKGLYAEPKGPSVWQKMNNGTKSFFVKSKQMVPSWLMPETQERVKKSENSFTRSSNRIREELRTARRNIVAPWTRPKETKEEPKTVSDFLALPKPE